MDFEYPLQRIQSIAKDVHQTVFSIASHKRKLDKDILLITHVDMDGAGAYILSEAYSKVITVPGWSHKVTVKTCGYGYVDKVLQQQVTTKPWDLVLVTDISVNQETAELLDELNSRGTKVVLLDHHKSADWLNKYSWAVVAEKEKFDFGFSRCGTYWTNCFWSEVFAYSFVELMDSDYSNVYYDYLWNFVVTDSVFTTFKVSNQKFYDWFVSNMEYLVTSIDEYDTWKWSESGELWPALLNRLFEVKGFWKFSHDILGSILQGYATESRKSSQLPYTFPVSYLGEKVGIHKEAVLKDIQFVTSLDLEFLELQDIRFMRELSRAEKSMLYGDIVIDVNESTSLVDDVEYRVGIIFGFPFISEGSKVLAAKFPNIDIFMFVSFPGSVSLRTAKNLAVSLDILANLLGVGAGGGHTRAAGYPISSKKLLEVIDMVTDKKFCPYKTK